MTETANGAVDRSIDWRSPEYYDESALLAEMERVFDICHGCRRCFNLCHSFPLLFDAIDESDSGELDTTPKTVYWEVAEQCYLCDMCYRAKCPYVPPHPFMVDFPRLRRSRADGEVLVFATCYGDYNGPEIVDDLFAVLEHNGIGATMMRSEDCCGMPKLELGDFEGVEALMRKNLPALASHARSGGAILAPVPSCALMLQQELPEMFPDDEDVKIVGAAVRDPMHYLWLRSRDEGLNTDFANSLGKVMYHAPCHTQVQNFGLKTPDVLKLAPDTTVDTIERCSGFDGVYGVRAESRAASEKIARAAVRSAQEGEWDHFTSDCPLAGRQILNGLNRTADYRHPVSLLRQAYGC